MLGTGSRSLAARKPYGECTACSSKRRTYSSAYEALQHLHTTHFECPFGQSATSEAKDRPASDDPCYAYIKPAVEKPEFTSDIMVKTKELIDNLSEISENLNKLHWLVATNSRDNLQRRRRRWGATTGPPLPPPLPRSLVYTFDELVACYVLHAKSISLENRAPVGFKGDMDLDKIHDLYFRGAKIRDRGRRTLALVKDYLQQARRDIILSRAEPGLVDGNEEEALGTMAFDPTSLVRALSVSVLYNTLSMPLPRRRAKGAAGSTTTPPPGSEDAQWDVIGIYKEYSKRLHAEAARRPRRRLFVDIRAFVDELMALRGLLNVDLSRVSM
jgi:hypothetical protein